jgi:hypothetical protein
MRDRFRFAGLAAALVAASCEGHRPLASSQPSCWEIPPWGFSVREQSLGRVDLLFVIDNSPSMGDAQSLLARAVTDLVNRLVNPDCLDVDNEVVGQSANGACPALQTPEFRAIHDMHVGVLTSSLGSRGSDQCVEPCTNPASTVGVDCHANDQGHLVDRGGTAGTQDESPIADEGSGDFLAWLPSGDIANGGASSPPNGVVALGGANSDSTGLITDFRRAVSGVHEHGCPFRATTESWYRFLVQPDPYASIVVPDGQHAVYQGVDDTILRQLQ